MIIETRPKDWQLAKLVNLTERSFGVENVHRLLYRDPPTRESALLRVICTTIERMNLHFVDPDDRNKLLLGTKKFLLDVFDQLGRGFEELEYIFGTVEGVTEQPRMRSTILYLLGPLSRSVVGTNSSTSRTRAEERAGLIGLAPTQMNPKEPPAATGLWSDPCLDNVASQSQQHGVRGGNVPAPKRKTMTSVNEREFASADTRHEDMFGNPSPQDDSIGPPPGVGRVWTLVDGDAASGAELEQPSGGGNSGMRRAVGGVPDLAYPAQQQDPRRSPRQFGYTTFHGAMFDTENGGRGNSAVGDQRHPGGEEVDRDRLHVPRQTNTWPSQSPPPFPLSQTTTPWLMYPTWPPMVPIMAGQSMQNLRPGPMMQQTEANSNRLIGDQLAGGDSYTQSPTRRNDHDRQQQSPARAVPTNNSTRREGGSNHDVTRRSRRRSRVRQWLIRLIQEI